MLWLFPKLDVQIATNYGSYNIPIYRRSCLADTYSSCTWIRIKFRSHGRFINAAMDILVLCNWRYLYNFPFSKWIMEFLRVMGNYSVTAFTKSRICGNNLCVSRS